MARKKRYRGHYCWACDRIRPNEQFSGRGHARHLCRECSHLGQEELAYRQAIRNLGRLVMCGGIIPRKKRGQFRKFLEHENQRVRQYALQLEVADAVERAEQRLMRDIDELFAEAAGAGDFVPLPDEPPGELYLEDDTAIPF